MLSFFFQIAFQHCLRVSYFSSIRPINVINMSIDFLSMFFLGGSHNLINSKSPSQGMNQTDLGRFQELTWVHTSRSLTLPSADLAGNRVGEMMFSCFCFNLFQGQKAHEPGCKKKNNSNLRGETPPTSMEG